MNKVLIAMMLIAGLTACSDMGKKAETGEAQKVETKKTVETVIYTKVLEGSQMDWRAAHLGGLEPRFGKVFLSNAEVMVTGGQLTNAKAVIDMNSFTVENFGDDEKSTNDLTGHLKSGDFFNVAENPTSTFELTKVEAAKGDYNSTLTGNLTIMGTTKSIAFNGNVSISETEVSIKSEDFSVDRKDWGLVYNVEGTEGVPANYIIADDLGFTIDIKVSK